MVHGIALFIIHFIRQIRPNTNNNYFLNLFKIFIVFNFVSLSWIFFRSPDLYIAFDMFAALTDFSFNNFKIVKDNQFYLLLILIFLIISLLFLSSMQINDLPNDGTFSIKSTNNSFSLSIDL